MGSRIPDRSINEGGGTRTHTLEALVPKTNAAAITPLPRIGMVGFEPTTLKGHGF